MQRNLIVIKNEEESFGFLFIGGSDTIPRAPLLNILVSDKNLSASVLELVDFQERLADGGNKDGTVICNRLNDHI